MWRIRYNSDATLLQFSSVVEPQQVRKVAASSRAINGKTVYIYELNYYTGIRWKRCVVAQATLNANTKNALVIGLPSSNSQGNGGYDLIDTPSGPDQQHWPLQLCADYGVFAVMLDHSLYGGFAYGNEFSATQQDELTDALCGIQAARYFIEDTPIFGNRKLAKAMFCGGLSWGGIETQFLAAACPQITHAYVGCGLMSKAYHNWQMFVPPEWIGGYDYKDMAGATSGKLRIQFGGNGSDYVYQPFKSPFAPDIDLLISQTVSLQPPRISNIINPNLGHELDVPDLKNWFADYINTYQWYIDPITG